MKQWLSFSRHAWLWVSGGMAFNGAWTFAFELYSGAVLYFILSAVLLLLFLTQKSPYDDNGKGQHV